MSLPKPELGMVIHYSYLWAREHTKGAEEGRKDRPCAIITASRTVDGYEIVTVVPITHSQPKKLSDAIEIPKMLKEHLGLDDMPSWVVVTEINEFQWPGPDLRVISRSKSSRFYYGMLPSRFLAEIFKRMREMKTKKRLSTVRRSK